MKRKLFFLTVIISTLSAPLSCNDPSRPAASPPRFQMRPLSETEIKFVRAVDKFWLNMFKAADEADRDRNVFISPLSISLALGMTLNGAAGETFDSIKTALSLEGLSETEVNQAARGLLALLQSADPAVKLQVANSIWHRTGFPVEPKFLNTNKDAYNAEIAALDFGSPSATETINAWVATQTNGTIPSIVDVIPPEMVMYLINAIYFKGDWTVPFDPKKTRETDFFLRDGASVPRLFMNREDTISYFRNDALQAAELPYGEGVFSMVLILPAEGTDVSDFLAGLDGTTWNTIVGGMQTQKIHLTVPKFKLRYDLDLKTPLTALGMGIAFDAGKADFRRISGEVYESGDRLFISEAKHKTFVEVNEEGTEAAAVTSIGIGLTSLPPSMVVNRPFAFVLRERTSGAILFAGKILDPVAE